MKCRITCRSASVLAVVILSGALGSGLASAQPPRTGGFGGGRFGAFGFGRLVLAGMADVQEELELSDTQRDAVEKLLDEMRDARAARPQGDGSGFGGLSEDEVRARVARRLDDARKTAATEREKLGQILSPPQMERLDGILVQSAGARALLDSAIAERVGLSQEQQQQIRADAEKASMRMRDLFQSGDRDREANRAKFAELRAESEKKSLEVLSPEQASKLEKIKGPPFEFAAGAGGPPTEPRRDGDAARPRRPRRPAD